MPYLTLHGAKTPIKVWVDDLSSTESEALDQLRKSANLPWVEAVAAMPDVHAGKGATVGSVIVSKGAVSPAVVGVDIGCGMAAVKTPFNANRLGGSYKLKQLREKIEAEVPVGFNRHEYVSGRIKSSFTDLGVLSAAGSRFEKDALYQLGTLGGGNHFIEICLDKEDRVWVMLHSGSRKIGKELAEYHIRTAKGLMADLVKRFGAYEIDKDLAALAVGTPEYDAYISDLYWCQRYARANRDEMMLRVLSVLSEHVEGDDIGPRNMTEMRVDCHHNYIEDIEHNGQPALLTRKGAVSAKKDELGIIPGSMGAKSFIVKGLGNEDSFCSCSHGAGRKMSRTKAKARFTLDDLRDQTAGVECRKDKDVIDEIPGAYKDILKVMAQQSDLVEVVAELRQVVCVKGGK